MSYHDANLPAGSRPDTVATSLRSGAEAVQAALSLAERRFQATFLHAPVGIAHVGMDGSFLMVNPRFAEITGYSAEALMRTGFQAITHPEDLNADIGLLARLTGGELPRYTMEKRYLRADGSFIWVNLTVAMARDEAGTPDFYVAVVEDMSEMRQAHFDAIHDPLTGLLNRRGFTAHAQRMVQHAAHEGQWLSIAYLDLDGFKALNDLFGHSVGDNCLVDIARLMEAMARPHDAIARMGGDEFVLMIPTLAANEATSLVERMRKGLADLGDDYPGISGSFGLLTLMPDAQADLFALVARADAAMLLAKRTGKNQVVVAPSE